MRRRKSARIHPGGGLWATLTLCAGMGTAAQAQALDQVQVAGQTKTRLIEGDELGQYYEIPAKGELTVAVDGPGTLLVFLVNHRAPRLRRPSLIQVSKKGRAWKRLKLPCPASKRRFVGDTVIPCGRITRDIRVSGTHLPRARW